MDAADRLWPHLRNPDRHTGGAVQLTVGSICVAGVHEEELDVGRLKLGPGLDEAEG